MSFHRHLFEQRRGIVALLGLVTRGPSASLPDLPGPIRRDVVSPPSDALVDDFVRFCRGDPSVYRDTLPPHLFPQWSLPTLLETAKQLPYPPIKVINQGFRLHISGPLPRHEQLHVSGQLQSVEESGSSAKITIRVETSIADRPPALSADLRVLVRLPRPKSETQSQRPNKERPRVPNDARELVVLSLGARAGLHFAELTGDFNPIHWLVPYAKAMGFRSAILHGFGTSAIATEALTRALLAGRIERLTQLDVNFVRPLVLPRKVGVYLHYQDGPSGSLSVGDAPGGPAYLVGSFELER